MPDTRATVSDEEIAAGVVCMMCGVAGSGKTTYAQGLAARGMVRLSVDEEIWRQTDALGFGGRARLRLLATRTA